MTTEVTYQLLDQVRAYLEQRGATIPGWRSDEAERGTFRAAVAEALAHVRVPDATIPELAGRVTEMLTGLGLLQALLKEPDLEEIIVRRGQLLVERQGQIEVRGHVATDGYFEALARRAADLGGRAMYGDRPFVLVDLPDQSRFTAMIPELSVEGTAINIRVHRRDTLRLGDLLQAGAFSPLIAETEAQADAEALADALRAEGVDAPAPPVVAFLAQVVRQNAASVLVGGEFSSGKTTLLGALLRLVRPETCLAVAETFKELHVAHPYPARVVVPEAVLKERGNLPSMREVVNVLYTRMRPDLIVFGEIVGDEAVPLLDAMNLGKRVLTTIHGDDCYGDLLRLELLALASGLPLAAVQERVARGIQLVVHLARQGRRRYISEVALVSGYDRGEGKYRLQELYRAGERDHAPTRELETLWQHCQPRS